MSKHTPGPWRLGEMRDGYQFIDAEDGSWYEFASVAHTPLHARLNEIAKANARLIAAAPDLLQAAKDAMKIIDAGNKVRGSEGYLEPVCLMLRAAIAKAEGQP